MALTPTAYPHGFVCVGPGDGVGVEAIGVVEGFAATDPKRRYMNGSRRDILSRNSLTFSVKQESEVTSLAGVLYWHEQADGRI